MISPNKNAHITDSPALKTLFERVRGRFSTELGIDLSTLHSDEIFKWFLASILFGGRISEAIAKKTYREFERAEVLSPDAIMRTGWDGLVEILDSGGYVRYDFKTATKLLEMSETLVSEYRGNLNTLHSLATDSRDLENRLRSLAKGIGDVTVNIFLREMRGLWEKSNPLPSDLVVAAARDLGLIPKAMKDRERILKILLNIWAGEGMSIRDFPDFETALLRVGLDYRRRK